ncbi:MAG: glycosyltransferase family 9 protein, partial [Candidatus Zixiibacteriota bacterium]
MPKLVLRAPNHLGDSVMSLSAIGGMRDLFRDSQIHVLAPESVSGLFKRHPSVDEVLQLKDGHHHGLKSISATRAALLGAGGGFEIGVLLTESFSAAAGFKRAGVTNSYGMSANARSPLLTASLKAPPKAGARIHRSVIYQRLVRFSAEKFWANPYWVGEVAFERPEIYLSEGERSAAAGILERSGVSRKGFVALSPRAVAESRRWGVENYSELTRRIVRELDLSVALIGSTEDKEDGEAVRELAGGGVINLCGATRVRGAAATLAGALAFVGNDSGLGHLAALVNTPLIILSGADDPNVTSPLSDMKSVIIRSELECISCVK